MSRGAWVTVFEEDIGLTSKLEGFIWVMRTLTTARRAVRYSPLGGTRVRIECRVPVLKSLDVMLAKIEAKQGRKS